MKKIGGEKMSKNLIVLFIVALLIVGGFSIYTYDQSNQAKKELEEENLKLESSNELISELKENIKEKEKQIEELKANLTKEKKDLEQEYTDKLSILTEEKAKLEASLAEKEKIWLDKDKEKEQFVIKLEEEVKGYKENISKLDNEIVNLKEGVVQLTKEKKDLEQEYTDKLSGLMDEKINLGTLLAETEEMIKTINTQKEEAEQAVFSKDRLIEEKEVQINELQANLTKEKKDLEQEYTDKLSGLMEEKAELEAQLIQQEEMLKAKDREKEEFITKLETYTNQINELRDKLTLQESEKEKDYTEELSILQGEKSAFEAQLKTSQDLLSERDNTITVLKQQTEESEKNLADKDKIVIELSESIKGYENQITEIKEQMAKEGKEKEAEYTNRLSLLREEKNIVEAKLADAIQKGIPDYYEVKRGDSLWNIAEGFYNQGEKWIRIFEANKEKIKDPDLIYPYQRFTIPKE